MIRVTLAASLCLGIALLALDSAAPVEAACNKQQCRELLSPGQAEFNAAVTQKVKGKVTVITPAFCMSWGDTNARKLYSQLKDEGRFYTKAVGPLGDVMISEYNNGGGFCNTHSCNAATPTASTIMAPINERGMSTNKPQYVCTAAPPPS